MNLNDTQKQQVKTWINDGLKLSDIQNRIVKEFGIKMTYMDVRFLVDDLKVMPKDPEPVKPPTPPPAPAAATDAPQAAAPAAEPEDLSEMPTEEEIPALAGGKVSVSVDAIAVPGAMVSGKVTFSDGQSAQWYLDEMGRLGLACKQKGYRPPQADIPTFQAALQRELAKMGM
jgi:hypothetical protein